MVYIYIYATIWGILMVNVAMIMAYIHGSVMGSNSPQFLVFHERSETKNMFEPQIRNAGSTKSSRYPQNEGGVNIEISAAKIMG